MESEQLASAIGAQHRARHTPREPITTSLICAVGGSLETWSEAMYAAYRGRQLLLFGSVHREAAAFRCWRERYGEGGSRRNKYWGRVAVRDIMWA